jgi:hypothetical protein
LRRRKRTCVWSSVKGGVAIARDIGQMAASLQSSVLRMAATLD